MILFQVQRPRTSVDRSPAAIAAVAEAAALRRAKQRARQKKRAARKEAEKQAGGMQMHSSVKKPLVATKSNQKPIQHENSIQMEDHAVGYDHWDSNSNRSSRGERGPVRNCW